VTGKDHGRHGQCLTEETLTEYLEGGMDPAIKAVSEVHLIGCDDCRSRLGFFMRVLEAQVLPEESHSLQAINSEWDKKKHQQKAQRRTGTSSRWLLGLMAVAAVLVAGVLSIRSLMDRLAQPRSASEIVQLLLNQHRPFESRMANEPYIPIQRTRGVEDPGGDYGLLAGEMTKRSADSHQMGCYYLLQKDFAHAIPYLEIAEREVGAAAAVHNDLGVALLEQGDPAQLSRAGQEFRHALDLDQRFEPAVFNLALFYERMSEPLQAATQWNRYLELDSKSDWSKEAEVRLQGLSR
jgi:tetratricopeptide (TPR) repeat protein